MILDFWMFPKDLESVLWSSLLKQDKESLLLKDKPSLLINLPKLLPLERMSSLLEALEIEKQKDISVCIQVKEDLTLLQELEPKVGNSREPEEEDENNIYLKI